MSLDPCDKIRERQTPCAVKHVFIECKAFSIVRKRFFKVNNLGELFENVNIYDVLSLLRKIGLYQRT